MNFHSSITQFSLRNLEQSCYDVGKGWPLAPGSGQQLNTVISPCVLRPESRAAGKRAAGSIPPVVARPVHISFPAGRRGGRNLATPMAGSGTARDTA